MKWQRLQRNVFISFLTLLIAFIFIYNLFGENVEIEKIREVLGNLGIWAPLIFILLYTLGTIFIPSTPFMALAGILFGFKYGLLYTVIGGFLSSIIVFGIGRFSGKTWVESVLEHRYLKHLNIYNKRLESGGLLDLIILRVLPVMPFNVLNILMGVSKIKLRVYIVGTLLGLAPSNLIAVYFGTFITKIF